MKAENIYVTSKFKRSYRKRIKGTEKEKLFKKHLEMFMENPFNPQLRNHALTGKLKGSFAFSIGYALRVVYTLENKEKTLLADIGTHEQVYPR